MRALLLAGLLVLAAALPATAAAHRVTCPRGAVDCLAHCLVDHAFTPPPHMCAIALDGSDRDGMHAPVELRPCPQPYFGYEVYVFGRGPLTNCYTWL